MKWFKHLTASRTDPDIGDIIHRFGYKGYFIFFRTLEIISDEFCIETPGEITKNFKWFLDQFPRNIDKKTLLNFYQFCENNLEKKRIICRQNGKTITVKFPKLKDLTDDYTSRIVRSDSEVSSELVRNESGMNPVHKNKEVRIKNKDIKKEEKNKSIARNENRSKPSSISFDFDSQLWEGISDKDKELWAKTYPACDIDRELLKMADWLISNPTKRKSNYRKFISNWLSRQQDRGGSQRGTGSRFESDIDEWAKNKGREQ